MHNTYAKTVLTLTWKSRQSSALSAYMDRSRNRGIELLPTSAVYCRSTYIYIYTYLVNIYMYV